jgi:hypothetical protein
MLDDRLPQARPQLSQRTEGGAEIGARAHVLDARRARHALLGEQPTGTRLRPERPQTRVRAEDRDVQREREPRLQLAGHEGKDDRQLRIDHQPPNPREQARPVEQLRRQRTRRTVDRRNEKQPAARLGRVELPHETEPVLDNLRQNRLRRHIDHP